MARKIRIVVLRIIMALALCTLVVSTTLGQAPPPSEQMQSMSFGSPIAPALKYARNMAILNRLDVNTFNNCFEYCVYDSSYYLIVKETQQGMGDDPDTSSYRFYDVTNPSHSAPLGRINLPVTFAAGDIETFIYADTTRLIFYGARNRSDTAGFDLYLDVLVGPALMTRISDGEVIDSFGYSNAEIYIHHVWSEDRYNEMIYGYEHHLLLATNLDILRIIDLTTKTTFDLLPDIQMYPDTIGTKHEEVKNHEVKAFTRSNGDIVVGVGVVRSGMRILYFDSNWNLDSTRSQNYDHDRTLLPETIINPTKVLWDSTIYQPLSDFRNNKWDHRVCHSVLPYDDENGGQWALTIDEFTSSYSGQYENGEWISGIWEGIDFYAPNLVNDTFKVSYPIWNDGQPVLDEKGSPIHRTGWDRFLESDTLRLNYAHWNHPQHLGVDPLRLQGAFLRIWDRARLGTNDTTANDIPMLRNAYDAQESESHPEGYVGLENIPEVSDVPTGLHEPYLIGNTLYLAGYNTGARILKLTGDSIAVRAYCRTESFLSNDPASEHFYMRPDLIMYAKGFYRYVPDQNRPGITYGSDPYNGMWIIRYFDCDSAIVDTLKHIAFQDTLQIGTVESGKPMHFRFGAGGAVIADSAIVEFVDNTSFSWDSEDSLVVLGQLQLGAIHLDSTQYAAPRNRIFVGDGGVVLIGGMEKTITGKLNLHVGPGGRAVILAGTTLQLADSSLFLIEGELTFESCVLSDGCHFIARDEGIITIDTAADVTGLLDCRIADERSVLQLSDSCVVRMQRGGTINVYGHIVTPAVDNDQPAWCRVQSMHANQNYMCQPGDEWNGILLYGNWHDDTFENAFIHHGYPGLWVYGGNPLIMHSEFSKNLVGCRITEGQARLAYNRFEKNEYIGLDMQLHDYPAIKSNRLNENINYGLYVYGCADAWYDNRIDSNSTGAYVTEYSDIYLNEWESWSPSMTCDTTQGNSIRHNKSGIRVAGYSSTEFHCDNSVYHNYSASPQDAQDIVVYGWSRAVGWGNYPDTAAVTPHAIRFVKERYATAQWDDPSDSLASPSTDPVLHKSASQSPFASALARGRASMRQGLYQSAQTDFALALNLATTRDEFVLALQTWRRMVNMADQDSLNGPPGYRSAYWTTLASALTGNAQYADSTWMRNIAAEILLTEQIKRRDTTGVSFALQALVNGNPDDEVARRTRLRHVVFDECVRNDHTAALARYQSLQSAYPRSQEAVYAKILLRLHLDSMDIASLAKLPAEQSLKAERYTPQTAGLVIEGPWPTPQRDEAFLRVWSDEATVVDRSVYDMRGVRLRRDQGIALREGWNEMALRLDGFASGAYVLVFERNDRRYSVRMNVVRDR